MWHPSPSRNPKGPTQDQEPPNTLRVAQLVNPLTRDADHGETKRLDKAVYAMDVFLDIQDDIIGL